MNEPFQLVTNCSFKGKDYLVQMCVLNSKKLELIVTDKLMAEDWQCEYDASYIEALTHKTGNYKQFDVFIIMLKSGLLKTSECITLDLLTLEDLEELRNKKIINSYSSSRSSQNPPLNRRYLILTYSVEFDRIHYPLPLEYCGPPNPSVLQSNIRRLEAEVERLKQKNIHLSKTEDDECKRLREKIKFLTNDNEFLSNEVRRLNKLLSKKEKPGKNVQILENTLKKLEDRVVYERNQNHQSILKLKAENRQLTTQIEDLKRKEKSLRMQLRDASRQFSQRRCKRLCHNFLSPDHSAERKNRLTVDRADSPPYQPVLNRNSPVLARATKPKNLKKIQNRFLTSSSSESGAVVQSNKRSGETMQSTDSRQPLYVKTSVKSQSGSNEGSRSRSRSGSRHSSVGSKCRLVSQQSSKNFAKTGNSQDCKTDHERRSKSGVRSRESSLSSRCSSKQSGVSRYSNRGSGDHKSKNKLRTRRNFDGNHEDLKFSVSDLETRIHALQKLLSEGIKF